MTKITYNTTACSMVRGASKGDEYTIIKSQYKLLRSKQGSKKTVAKERVLLQIISAPFFENKNVLCIVDWMKKKKKFGGPTNYPIIAYCIVAQKFLWFVVVFRSSRIRRQTALSLALLLCR